VIEAVLLGTIAGENSNKWQAAYYPLRLRGSNRRVMSLTIRVARRPSWSAVKPPESSALSKKSLVDVNCRGGLSMARWVAAADAVRHRAVYLCSFDHGLAGDRSPDTSQMDDRGNLDFGSLRAGLRAAKDDINVSSAVKFIESLR